ncbi:hypothetical protein RG47T_0342 [Mucilaginibacter polytrichastri]|uniref:Peptidase S74 domain-containing protein n=2 Tax=Mucilaginibacter polytrichastri TaxID=1302689 RepID=A0A1Q5ZT07_9SPHI|nr:hypothetical protein RG47T_0342 [Mucilaginibacter polytrichastri]
MSADVVIGSTAGTRHDGSIMWWSSGSASRISATGDVFNFSIWSSTTPNVTLASAVGGSSSFQGKLGIGTPTPQAWLDIGTTANSGDLTAVLSRLSEGNTNNGGTYLGIKAYDSQPTATTSNLSDIKSFAIEHSFYGITNSSVNFLRGQGRNGGSISFNTNDNSEKMRILYNGNVGIGTKSPDAKLTVSGTIHSSAVLVDQNVPTPDYVFDKEYDLATLKEVKTYIDKNHHLPEIPSAAEVAKDGINLGEMNTKLLKKIEELTLYLIEKDKEIKQENLKLQSQQSQMAAMKRNNDARFKKLKIQISQIKSNN